MDTYKKNSHVRELFVQGFWRFWTPPGWLIHSSQLLGLSFEKLHTGWFFYLALPQQVPSTEKLINARLGVSRTMYVNVDSPNIGFPYFNFVGEAQWKKSPCIKGVKCLIRPEDKLMAICAKKERKIWEIWLLQVCKTLTWLRVGRHQYLIYLWDI